MHPRCWENRLISSSLAKQFPLSGIVLESSLRKSVQKGEKMHSMNEKLKHKKFTLKLFLNVCLKQKFYILFPHMNVLIRQKHTHVRWADKWSKMMKPSPETFSVHGRFIFIQPAHPCGFRTIAHRWICLYHPHAESVAEAVPSE